MRVAVVGAHAVVAAGLRSILESAADVEVASTAVPGRCPDVVVYDAIDLDRDAGATLDDLVRRHGSRVLVVSRDLRPALEARARAHGAGGGFSLEATADEILRAVREAARAPVPASEQRPCDDSYALARCLGLTPREYDVLSGITGGLSNDEIATAHTLSINSVKSYIRYAYRKIGVTTRAQAVAWCLERGFEPPRPGPGRHPDGEYRRRVSRWPSSPAIGTGDGVEAAALGMERPAAG